MKRQIKLLHAICLAALTCVAVGCQRGTDHGHGHGHAEHDDEPVRGPHGGRMLESGGFAMEITIFESGVSPEYRVFPTDKGTAVNLQSVKLSIELHRPGGIVDRIGFAPRGDYLLGDAEVKEPHSFLVKVRAQHAGKTHSWEYESFEGRAVLTAAMARSAGIKVETAGPAVIPMVRHLMGQVTLNQDRATEVRARFNGQVEEVRKSLGDRVRKGDVLAVLDSRELADLRADFIEAVHKLELAQAFFTREEDLWKKRVGAERDYLVAKHQLEEAEITKQTALQKLHTLGIGAQELGLLAREPAGEMVAFKARQPFPDRTLTRYEVKAPIDGMILQKHVTQGSIVDGEASLFMVADLASVWVDVVVHPSDLSLVRKGVKVRVQQIKSDVEVDGEIGHVSPVADESSLTSLARIVLPNENDAWRPGLFVTVSASADESSVPVAVRPSALQTFRDWDVVFIRDGDVFQAMPVELGRRSKDWVEVLSGLKPGQQYATENSFVIKAEVLKHGATHDH